MAAILNESAGERRAEERERSQAKLRIAYTRGAVIPADGNLVEVECHHVSRSGCAYWAVNAPDLKELIMVFGEAPNAVRIKARVVHWEVAEHDGRLRTLIGCEFLERLSMPPLTQTSPSSGNG